MLCTFCGTENRPEHKFCGMCGVRLERRQTDRRVRQEGVSLKCGSCSHVNEPGQKFCGMCGTRVERRVQERRGSGLATEPRAAAIANAQLPSPEAKGRTVTQTIEPPRRKDDIPATMLPRRSEPAIFRNEPANGGNGGNISGPSFLGLSTDKGGDTDYLLEDEPSGGGLRKLVLLIIIIAIVGLVFMQWRSSVRANPKAAPAKTDPATTAAPADKNQPEGATTTNPPADGATKPADPDAKPESDNTTTADPKESKADPPAKPSESASPVPAASAAEIPDKDKEPPDTDAAPVAATKSADDAHLADYKPSSALLRAQQFLRGRGVQQSCEQGLLYLHAATDKNDPGAAIQMAALYSSGVCVKQDRVMAYRWFNSAHELQPGNMWIQKNMDQLWAQMSSQERRLAGY